MFFELFSMISVAQCFKLWFEFKLSLGVYLVSDAVCCLIDSRLLLLLAVVQVCLLERLCTGLMGSQIQGVFFCNGRFALA